MNRSKSKADTIVVKIGTESLFHGENGTFGGEKLESVCADVSHILNNTPDHVILISSGAVGFGKRSLGERYNESLSNQYLASIGQIDLMLAYKEHFKKHHIIIGQALATHADIEDYENHADSLLGVTKSHFEMRTLLILNENDTLSTEELIALDRGIDNDKNALLHAKLNKAKTLYIITNTNGVYKKKDDPNSWIPEIQYRELTNGYIERLTGEKIEEKGKKGMCTKLEVAREAAKHEITTHIINGTESRLIDHYRGKYYGGTVILPD